MLWSSETTNGSECVAGVWVSWSFSDLHRSSGPVAVKPCNGSSQMVSHNWSTSLLKVFVHLKRGQPECDPQPDVTNKWAGLGWGSPNLHMKSGFGLWDHPISFCA